MVDYFCPHPKHVTARVWCVVTVNPPERLWAEDFAGSEGLDPAEFHHAWSLILWFSVKISDKIVALTIS